MIFLGIDPGRKGGLVAVDSRGRCLSALRMPLTRGSKGDIDWPAVRSWLDRLPAFAAVVEEASIRPKESGRSGLTIGRNWGRLAEAVESRAEAAAVLTPQQWRGECSLPRRPAKDSDKRKDDAIRLADTVPGLDMRTGISGRATKPHDGLADAACMALAAKARWS